MQLSEEGHVGPAFPEVLHASNDPLLLLLSHSSRVRLCVTPPGSPIPGILQARTLEWVAISFSDAWKWKWSHSVVSDSSRPHGLQPTRFLWPWDFPGKSTGVGCHCLLCVTIILALITDHLFTFTDIFISPYSLKLLSSVLLFHFARCPWADYSVTNSSALVFLKVLF